MASKTKVLYVCQEMMPYLPESEMSAVCRNLPQVIQEQGNEIRIFMPKFGCVNERRNQLHEVIRLSGMNIVIDDTDHQLIIKVASIPNVRVQVYFIDNDDYFTRKHILKDDNEDHFEDNDERSIFFARGVIETVNKLRWSPDIIHCHGWFSAIIAVYIKTLYANDPLFSESKIVLSLYDDVFTKSLDVNLKNKLLLEGFDESKMEPLTDPTYDNFIKYIMQFIDGLTYTSREVISDELLETANKLGIHIQSDLNSENYIEKSSNLYNEIIIDGK